MDGRWQRTSSGRRLGIPGTGGHSEREAVLAAVQKKGEKGPLTCLTSFLM